ncbi:ribosomal protein S18-alanine N-acetyltransferase [Halomonas qaidamensis]|uniref:[Ribosomal protein bS18]-alanine N-acetyltransferase n=1 Tax=Halomonas qaidamensis TaxID=2866211 RepID=A0ABY6JSK6_9GAMM|nr:MULTISPECIES: ribosomal protein S18-alanine N-acetyltransferase [Halomonas]UYV19519.1 ribosomal protein S18-alanine N-acetyltransferase [Halomonas qaidamensis]
MIRQLSIADSAELQALEAQANSGIGLPHLRNALADANSQVIGYWQQEPLIGYAMVARLPFEAELQAIGVLPQEQGQRVGYKLLSEVVACARQWQSERLLLEVRVSNQRAIKLYRHYGFHEDGRRRNYYPAAQGEAGREDALLMSLLL